MDAAV
jgi:hypothetical protein